MQRLHQLHHRNLLLFLALAYTAIRHRKSLLRRLNAILATTRRTAHIADLATHLLSRTTTDLLNYLQPTLPPPPRPLRRRTNTQSQPHAPVPRSIRRLLRLAASPDALQILRSLAGGAGQGIVREMSAQNPNDTSNVRAIMDTIATPQGMQVATTLLSTAVREAVTSAMEFQPAGAKNGPDRNELPISEVVMKGVLSEKGRLLIVELVTSVTRVVVPMIIAGDGRETTRLETGGCAQMVASPILSPLRRKRHSSWKGADSPSKHIVMSMMRAQGGSGVVERLALLAIRDKALVRDVVRTVVGEAVRTYLTTKRELEGGLADGKRANTRSDADRGGGERVADRTEGGEGEIGTSLWRMMIASVVTDFKRALIRRGETSGSSGWVVF